MLNSRPMNSQKLLNTDHLEHHNVFEYLPMEIILNILTHLTRKDLIIFSLTSRRSYELFIDDYMWKHLIFVDYRIKHKYNVLDTWYKNYIHAYTCFTAEQLWILKTVETYNPAIFKLFEHIHYESIHPYPPKNLGIILYYSCTSHSVSDICLIDIIPPPPFDNDVTSIQVHIYDGEGNLENEYSWDIEDDDTKLLFNNGSIKVPYIYGTEDYEVHIMCLDTHQWNFINTVYSDT